MSWVQFFADPRWDLGRRLIVGLFIGIATGLAAVGFRFAFGFLSDFLLKTGGEGIASASPILLFCVPALGGLVVGLATWLSFGRGAGGRGTGIPGVADVVLAQTRDRGVLHWLDATKAALINILALSAGASVGREGPLVHLGATLGSLGGGWLQVDDTSRRIYVACGVAAGVAASFNAPLAGLFFAIEIALGGLTSLSLAAIGPVVLSAIAGTLVSRNLLGPEAAFEIAQTLELSIWEFPAFVLLGFLCAGVSICFLNLMKLGWRLRRQVLGRVPSWTHPTMAGILLGFMALWMPEVLGVGYDATFKSLSGDYATAYLLGLVCLKITAVLVCLILGFGSGIFSPALMIGALIGVLFGQVATFLAPQFPADIIAYGYAGMGAMVGAILGAPLSTILMVFELTQDYTVTIAVMLSVIVAAQLTHAVVGNTFFGLQLEQRGVRIVLGG